MKRFHPSQTKEMAELLKNDEVISVPTDTVYGVCARMSSEKAQENLRRVKNRPLDKAFPIMCADIAQIKTIAKLTKRDEQLIQTFMPGPVTFVFEKKDDVPEFVNGGMATLAIRMATSHALEELIREVGEPVYMTSANQSGMPVATTLDEIEDHCPLLAGMMEGDTQFGQSSTIVDCTKPQLTILRQGPITLEQLNAMTKDGIGN